MSYQKIGTNHRLVKDYGNERDRWSLKGEVEVGYDLHTDPVTGISSLGEVIVRKKNQILMGGSIFALEKMFNVQSSLTVDYLNNIMGIGQSGPAITERYPRDTSICLWTIGIGGAGASIDDINSVLQQQRELRGIIPFRVVDAPFEEGSDEYNKYWLMKRSDDGKYMYYGKKFDKTTVITPLWKDAGDDKDGSPVVESDYSSARTTPIETFAETVLCLETADLREYFNLYQSTAGTPRFNEFGLCTGVLGDTDDGKEYKQVLQATAVSFGNELLHMEKNLYILYRVYTK